MALKPYLRRLDRLWIEQPIFFVTTSTHRRAAILAQEAVRQILEEVWANATQLYGWQTGRYVIMPDHVHFFCAPAGGASDLSVFVGKWKEWTAKYLIRRRGVAAPVWQTRFFDHVLRSEESLSEKWEYFRQNPVRAGLVTGADEWPYQGELARL